MNIPTRDKCLELLKEYNLSEKKIHHSILVADVALFLAKKLIEKGEKIDLRLVEAGALLHDIAKSESYTGDSHSKDGEEIVKRFGFEKLMPIIRKHELSGILEYRFDTWEEKLVYYADKRARNEIRSIDERTKKWPELFPEFKEKIFQSVTKAKELEKEIFSKLDFKPEDLKELIKVN